MNFIYLQNLPLIQHNDAYFKEKAKKLISEGLTHINQLHSKKWLDKLSEETKLYLKLKPVKK